MLYPWEHNARSPVLQQRVVFTMKVMVTPQTTTSGQDHTTAGNLHAAVRQPDSDHTVASKREMQF